jgi:uncharacterized protein (TIGR03083 family)
VTTATDPTPWVRAVRASHDRLAALVPRLDADGLRARSYDTDWSVADVLSHLGSGAEITSLALEAGVTGAAPPSPDAFQAIWATWNARSPEEQATQYLAANEALVNRVESLTAAERDTFEVQMFGPAPVDLAAFLGMRLSEHAVHTWDIAVTLDPAARVAPDAVDLLVDSLPMMAGFSAKQAPDPASVAVTTTGPGRVFTLDTGGVSLVPGPGETSASVALPAEAFLRLVYGRLDGADEVTASGVTVPELKAVFPGF